MAGELIEIVPADAVAVHLVYRLELTAPLAVAASDAGFHLLRRPGDALALASMLRRRHGLRASARTLAKLATRRRILYCLTRSGLIVHEGWLTVSHCDLYPVADGDVVIGPMSTDPGHRGQGLAPLGLRHAMNAMLAGGHGTFYVHTRARNLASRRAIAKAGFGPPIAAHIAPRSPG